MKTIWMTLTLPLLLAAPLGGATAQAAEISVQEVGLPERIAISVQDARRGEPVDVEVVARELAAWLPTVTDRLARGVETMDERALGQAAADAALVDLVAQMIRLQAALDAARELAFDPRIPQDLLAQIEAELLATLEMIAQTAAYIDEIGQVDGFVEIGRLIYRGVRIAATDNPMGILIWAGMEFFSGIAKSPQELLWEAEERDGHDYNNDGCQGSTEYGRCKPFPRGSSERGGRNGVIIVRDWPTDLFGGRMPDAEALLDGLAGRGVLDALRSATSDPGALLDQIAAARGFSEQVLGGLERFDP